MVLVPEQSLVSGEKKGQTSSISHRIDPWCWYINANIKGVYSWDPCYYIYQHHGSYGYVAGVIAHLCWFIMKSRLFLVIWWGKKCHFFSGASSSPKFHPSSTSKASLEPPALEASGKWDDFGKAGQIELGVPPWLRKPPHTSSNIKY